MSCSNLAIRPEILVILKFVLTLKLANHRVAYFTTSRGVSELSVFSHYFWIEKKVNTKISFCKVNQGVLFWINTTSIIKIKSMQYFVTICKIWKFLENFIRFCKILLDFAIFLNDESNFHRQPNSSDHEIFYIIVIVFVSKKTCKSKVGNGSSIGH